MRSHDLERVAETQCHFRPQLERALRNSPLVGPALTMFPGCTTYHDVWESSLSHHFFDMATLVRIASAIESALKNAYMQAKGHNNLKDLRADPNYKMNQFQRILPWHNATDNGLALLATVSVDLRSHSELQMVQEAIFHRHLYAHNLGVIDEQYVDRLKILTGIDLTADPRYSAIFPDQDCYYFDPLTRISDFIKSARGFLASIP